MFIFATGSIIFFALSAGSVDSIPDESLAVNLVFGLFFGLFALIGELVCLFHNTWPIPK